MDLDYYKGLVYRIQLEEDPDTGGYMACIPALKGCMTCGMDKESALKNLEDAKREWLRTALERRMDVPEPDGDSSALIENLKMDKQALWKSLLGSVPGGDEFDVETVRDERLDI